MDSIDILYKSEKFVTKFDALFKTKFINEYNEKI